MVTRVLAAALLLSAGPWLAGCASEARCVPMRRCDVRTRACQSSALKQAACLRGLDEEVESLKVRVVVRDFEQYAAEQVKDAQSAADGEARDQMRRGLSLFGLAPEEADAESAVRAQVRLVGAFYDSDRAEVTILDRGYAMNSPGTVVMLVHEMVHALQDRAGQLSVSDEAARIDAHLARLALVEGEAALLSDEALAEGYGYHFADLNYASALRSYRGGQLSFAQFDDADPLATASLRFPYAFGASYLWPLRKQTPEAVETAFGTPPVSTYAVMNADPERPDLRTDDLDQVAVPELPDLTLVGVRHLGRFMYQVAFDWPRKKELRRVWFPDGAHFVADTMSVFVDERGDVLTAWRIRFDSVERAQQLAQDLNDTEGAPRADSEDRDVILFAAERPDLLDALPEPLAWSEAPDADFDFGTPPKESPARPLLCPLSALSLR